MTLDDAPAVTALVAAGGTGIGGKILWVRLMRANVPATQQTRTMMVLRSMKIGNQCGKLGAQATVWQGASLRARWGLTVSWVARTKRRVLPLANSGTGSCPQPPH